MVLSYSFILLKIAPVFLLLGIGVIVRWRNLLNAAADPSLMKLVVQVLYPALILKYILGNEALLDIRKIWAAPLLGYGTVVGCFAVAWLAGGWLPKRHPKTRRSFALTTGIFNYGFIPIPIVLALFSEGGNAVIGVLLLFNVGVEAALWTVGVALLTAGHGEGSWKRLFNAATLTLVGSVVMNQTGGYELIPAVGYDTIAALAACAIPFGLMLAGATLADLLREERGLLRDPWPPGLACALRLGLLPMGFLLVARFLPGLNEELRRVLVVQAAMPSAIFPLVINRFYQGDSRTAVQVVLGTTVVGIVTIPLWLSFGLGWVF